jgi:hypothetical protein
VTPNITADPAAGIGFWTDEEIKRAVRRESRAIVDSSSPPMAFPFYAGLSDEDVGDIRPSAVSEVNGRPGCGSTAGETASRIEERAGQHILMSQGLR